MIKEAFDHKNRERFEAFKERSKNVILN